MDCRRSSKKENIALSYLILQSRKRNLDIYYTTQNMDFCDLRLIQYTSIFVIAQRCYKQVIDNYGNTKLEELEKIRNYTIIDSRMRKDNITRINMNIEPFFKHYDTNQIIEPLFRTNKDVKKTT
jgi:hypothetical protein